jgi:hypothetical protein
MDLSAEETSDDGGFDKGRQQIQQEIGNKIRPLEAQMAELKEMLTVRNAPKEDDNLDDDDYLTTAQARNIASDSSKGLNNDVQVLRNELHKIQHKNDFLTEYPGVNYNDTLEKAFALAREDNPGVPDDQLGQTAGGYMRRMARGKGKSEPVTTKSSQSKKAPDSTKGASVSNSSAPVPNDSNEYVEMSQDEIKARYFPDE